MAIGYDLCGTDSEVPVSICILAKCVVPILVSSHTNWDLNVSNNLLSDCFISWERLCKQGLLFFHHFLWAYTINRCLWHVVNGRLHMAFALPFVEGDMFVCVTCNNDM